MAPTQIEQRETIPRPSRRLLAVFSLYLHWYMGRAFHAVRLARAERFPVMGVASKTIVCLNHPSWWDPLTALLLSRQLAPRANHYAPMEASALKRYGFMQRLGLFPIDTHALRAGGRFLRAAGELLNQPNSVLWITPEGRFTDIRQRPAQWRPGIAALVARQQQCTIIPLAIEYTFWDERLPEALALIGEPLHIDDGRSLGSDTIHAMLTQSMMRTQDELAALGAARDPTAFATVLYGGSGVSLVYDAWKRLQARWNGQPYIAEHGGLPPA